MHNSSSGNGFTIPNGLHEAVATMVIDCGYHTRTGKFGTKTNRELYLRFELPECLIPDGEYAGQRATVGSRYNCSMYSKANLRKDLESWRGSQFTDLEADAFDPTSVIGKPAQVQIMINDAGYANINAILPSKQKHVPSETVVFDTDVPKNYNDLPEFVQRKINLPEAVQYQQEQNATQANIEQETPSAMQQDMADSMANADFDDSEIPF